MATPLLDKLIDEVLNHAFKKGFQEALTTMVEAVTKIVVICRTETKVDKIDKTNFQEEANRLRLSTAQKYADIVTSTNTSNEAAVKEGGFVHMKANVLQMFKQVVADLEEKADGDVT